MPRRTATLEDVARAAGVSQQTVSRVLNRPEVVSARTREQVIRAMQALHPISNSIPSAANIFIRRSITFLSSLKLGIPNRNNPPGASSLSNKVTLYPFKFS